MAQHFLLSAKARTLSLAKVFRMGEDAAYGIFCDMRWPETDGEPICPRCGCTESYHISTRRKFKCIGCHHQFSVTSGTIFASRKLSFTDLLAAVVIFVNGAKGISALQASRDLDVQYKTAFVLFHKLREAMQREFAETKLNGVVEIDGGYHDLTGEYDLEREKKLRELGWDFFRVSDKDVESDLDSVLIGIAKHLNLPFEFKRRSGEGSGMKRRKS